MKKKVVVGLSGGVDSSVAACLLIEQGYEVIGVTMQTLREETGISSEAGERSFFHQAVMDAEKAARRLNIPHYVMDFQEDFRKNVIAYFIREYEAGRTPNPCIACNRYVKWEALMQRAKELGADMIATGHYARIAVLPNGRMAVKQSVTKRKDQTYALYNLTQKQLKHTLMPVGEYEKKDIREIARKAGIPTADKADSMEICFVPDGDYASFIERETGRVSKAGNFVDLDGNVLGRHKGIIHYTVGQRKGLGIALGYPAFVLRLRPDTNEVVIGKAEDNLYEKAYMHQVNYMALEEFSETEEYIGKIRYNHPGAACHVKKHEKDLYECIFREKQRGVTPGQALVLYKDGVVVGGGTIAG